MRIRILDLETTGTEPTDKVVEIGAFDADTETGCVHWVGETFVNPGIPIPPLLSAIHHIIDADVAAAKPWPDAGIDLFSADVAGFSAHNAKFERQWVTDALTGGKPWICTLRCSYRVFPDAPGYKNQELRYWLNPDGLDREIAAQTHRAGPDAYVTGFILLELLKRASFEDLVKWSAQPAILPRLTFGKHRGAKFTAVPRDYLEWLCRQADMSEDIKFTAKTALGAKS